MMVEVVIYTKKHCPYCEAAKRLLKEKGIEFQEIDTTNDDKLREEITKKSGQQTVPQVFVDGHPLGGYHEISEFDGRGELDRILGIN